MLIRTFSFLFFLTSCFTFAAPSFPVLTYSTYLRDSFTPKAIATDSAGNIYMAGTAIVDAATSQRTILVVKLNPQASQYLYVRYFGGSVRDSANAISVDSAGNAYIAGATASPDFPVTGGGNLATPPAGLLNQRSFVAKLDPNGQLVFSTLLGGSAASSAEAVAVSASGQVVVTGLVSDVAGPAFPTTAGAFRVANTANHPYLLALDPTGTRTIFSATGIGGSAVALDPAGNIYVAGSTQLLDYPTTPGSYQPTFPVFQVCFAPPCSRPSQGSNQYVTKVDPTGSTLLYSTAVSGTGNTTNGGLAVDAAGNAYLTGYSGANYPYTVTPPALPIGQANSIFFFVRPFLSKLDPAGKTLLYSVPVGGAGVQVDARGSAYVSGGAGIGLAATFGVANNLPALADVPAGCLPDNQRIYSTAYASQVDSAGNIQGSQFMGGSTLMTSAVTLTGSTLWIAGATTLPDFPLTPNALTLPSLGPSALAGAYLGAVDFSRPQPAAATPRVFCVVDAADLAPIGAAARSQLLTLFGTGLGPATGVAADGNATTTLAGVSIQVGSISAPLLYVSSSQINFAVPLTDISQPYAAVQVQVNGLAAATRQLALTGANPSLFLNSPIQNAGVGFVALAFNADGSRNSAANPAPLGSGFSVFVNGMMPDPRFLNFAPQLSATNGFSVSGIVKENPFVIRVDLRAPTALVNNFSCPAVSVCAVAFTLYDVGFVSIGQPVSGGEAFGGVVYVSRTP